MDKPKCKTPSEHRALLASCIESLIEGTIRESTANAVGLLSAEIRLSMKEDFERKVYISENVSIQEQARVLKGECILTISEDSKDVE